MKKLFGVFLGLLLITSSVFADEGDRSAEHVLNRVWDTTNNALNATISGNLTGPITITENSDIQTFTNDGTDAYHTWSDGVLYLKTNEATNTESVVILKGKGTGYAQFQLWDGSATYYTTNIQQVDATFSINGGTSVTATKFNTAQENIDFTIETKNSATAFVANSDATAANEYIAINIPLSGDVIKFKAEAKASPDVTGGAPILVVSKDTSGKNRLQFYDGTGWRRITLE